MITYMKQIKSMHKYKVIIIYKYSQTNITTITSTDIEFLNSSIKII